MHKIDGFEFATYSGNNYYFFAQNNVVLSKETVEKYPERYKMFKNITGFSKGDSFYENCPNYSKEEIKLELLKNGFLELALEVTSKCNFRCKYCVYSGAYNNQREHGTHNMDLETAKKAIEKYALYFNKGRYLNPDRKPVISFYGGEPLINFLLIKKCVEYAKSIFEENIQFTITTNGSLLTEEIIDFLVSNNFNVVVSLDGHPENNDRNRKNANGIGTFQKVFSNINRLYKKQGFPVFISTVFDYKTDFIKMNEFFKNNSQIVSLAVNSVNTYNTDYFCKFTDADYEKFYKKLNRLKAEFLSGVKRNKTNSLSFISRVFGDICTSSFMRQFNFSQGNDKIIKHTGACIPGTKIFVDYEGVFYICEKVGRDYAIGDVNKGIDYRRCSDLVNNYNQYIVSKCRHCIIRNACKRCYVSVDMLGGNISIAEQTCKKQIENFIADLKFAYSVFEINPKWIGTYFNEYYDSIQEMLVYLK